MSAEWVCLVKDRESHKKYFPYKEVLDHPLKLVNTITETKYLNKKKSSNAIAAPLVSSESLNLALDGLDPLSHFVKQESIDPLSLLAAEYEHDINKKDSNKIPDKDEIDASDTTIKAWSKYRSSILTKFTTAEKLTIVSSFLSGGEMIKTQTTMSEKVKCRLEQLDDFEDGSVTKMMDLTQQEYQIRIEQLNQELIQAWNTDQRVRALKIAIQCSKLLADTTVMQFYPSQFVFITDILDIFGNLVYNRLRTKAEYYEPGSKVSKELPENFTAEMVPEAVKETCLNWFYKIASIRELLPRLYVEIALLKSYSFLTQNEFNQALLRLTRIIRGIGDPLVAAYARCYLCRVGLTVTSNNDFIVENLKDFLFVYHTMFNGGIRAELSHQRIDMASYLSMYEPAINWIMQSLSTSSNTLLNEIMDRCKEKKTNALLISSMLTTFNSLFISMRSNEFVTIISAVQVDGLTKGQLLRILGKRLLDYPPPDDQRLVVFNAAWKTMTTITNATEYIRAVEPWTEYISTYASNKEVNFVVDDIIVRMNSNRSFEAHYTELQSICTRLIDSAKSLETLLISENFLPLLDLLQKDSIRMEVCKHIMTVFKNNRSPSDPCSDAVLTNALMYICKILNDTTNAFSGEDERRQISELISYFIKIVDYDKDFEKQLSFYVEARTSFPNFDSVFVTLVHCVNLLAINTLRIINGQHTRKTAAFVRGCVAYCFITIPSITSITTQMDLYLLSGQVALANHCLGQADACFGAAIKLINELAKSGDFEGKKTAELYLVQFTSNLLSTLIIVPDSPEQGVLYLLRLLLEVIKQYPFNASGTSLTNIYIQALDMLTISAQDSYPYHIPNLISNDELYGSDPKFIAEINVICSQIVELILVELKALGDTQQLRAQSALSLDLFLRVVLNSNVSVEKVQQLAINLWNLAMKNKTLVDDKLPGKILMKIESYKGTALNHDLRHALEKVTSKMKMKM